MEHRKVVRSVVCVVLPIQVKPLQQYFGIVVAELPRAKRAQRSTMGNKIW